MQNDRLTPTDQACCEYAGMVTYTLRSLFQLRFSEIAMLQ